MTAGAINMLAAWVGISLGVIIGMGLGLFFHREDWLGGYDSWRRRMLRLGHIACFGIGGINLALSVQALRLEHISSWTAWPLAAAVLLMPGVCFLAAWRAGFRHLFFLPVACVLAGVMGFLVKEVWPCVSL